MATELKSSPRLDESRSYYLHQIQVTEAYLAELDKIIKVAPLDRERGRSSLRRLKEMLDKHIELENNLSHEQKQD